jgi:hypothetical protein
MPMTAQQIMQWDMAELAAPGGGNPTEPTEHYYYAPASNTTNTQAPPGLPTCTTGIFAYIGGKETSERGKERRRGKHQQASNSVGLPSTSLDSFVASGHKLIADTIYGAN